MSATVPPTRTLSIVNNIRQRIEARVLTPGVKLPSVRKMAADRGVAPSTVVEAYERLAGEGLIQARPGSGFYVAGPLAPLALSQMGDPPAREIDPVWMLRQSLENRDHALMPGCGWLPDDWLAGETLRKALKRLTRPDQGGNFSGYASPLGLFKLRLLLARRLAEQGLDASPDHILLTDSGTQALDLICRFFLQPDDCVLVDDPCYFNFLALLRAHRVKIMGVRMTPNGPDLSQFEALATQYRPRLYLTNSGCHNPTGASLNAATAHRLLKLAALHDMVVVEDDIFADFEATPAPRLAAYDGFERVLRIGSFSKSLSASLRCGHLAARADWIEALADLRIATSLSGSPLAAELLHTVLTDGSYRRHLETIRVRLAKSMARVIRRLRQAGLTPWLEPEAGLLLWTKLPQGIEAMALARQALAEDIVLAPGPVFSPHGGWQDYLRFNVAMSDDDRLSSFLHRAMGHG